MKTRDIYFDNLKAILILLVVLGHFANLNISDLYMGALNNVIYTFHMPLFVFVAGYFSKKIKSHRTDEIENLIYPYLVFQLLNYLFKEITGLGRGSINIFIPAYQNWFLIGLFIWRLLIPYYNLFNRNYLILATLILSIANIFFNDGNTFLKLDRVFYFFPMFILGYFCADLHHLMNKLSKYRYVFIGISLAGLLTVFVVSIIQGDTLSDQVYNEFTPSDSGISAMRMLVLLGGFFGSLVISFGLLYLIPRNKLMITYWGENTMNIFLAHMFFVFPLQHFLKDLPSNLLFPISLLSSVLTCILISTRFFSSILDPLTKFNQLVLRVNRKRN